MNAHEIIECCSELCERIIETPQIISLLLIQHHSSLQKRQQIYEFRLSIIFGKLQKEVLENTQV